MIGGTFITLCPNPSRASGVLLGSILLKYPLSQHLLHELDKVVVGVERGASRPHNVWKTALHPELGSKTSEAETGSVTPLHH